VDARRRLELYEGYTPPQRMDIEVVEAVWCNSATLDQHWRYRVRRRWYDASLDVYRRYSDFLALRSKLVARFPDQVVPALPEKQLPLQRGQSLAEERRLWFQAFLRAVLRHRTLAGSIWVKDFLTLASEEWQRRLVEAKASHKVDERMWEGEDLKRLVSIFSFPKGFALGSFGAKHENLIKCDAQNGRTKAVDSKYVKYCWADGPLEVWSPALGTADDMTTQNSQVKIEAQNGRMEAAVRLARASLTLIETEEGAGDESAKLVASLNKMDGLDQFLFENFKESVALRGTQSRDRREFVRQERKLLLVTLEAALSLRGGNAAYERLRKQRVDPAQIVAFDENALGEDFDQQDELLIQDFSRMMESFARAQIQRAKFQQRALQKVLESLRSDCADSLSFDQVLKDSRQRLGIGSAQKAFLWDTDTPM